MDSTGRTAPSPFTVLLVDPHEQVRLGLARRLATDVRVRDVLDAPTIRAAEPIVASAQPDVVIVDPSLPGGDWKGSVRRLTEIRGRSRWFLIAVHLPRGDGIFPAEAATLGIDLVLLKGLRTAQLIDQICQRLLRSAQE